MAEFEARDSCRQNTYFASFGPDQVFLVGSFLCSVLAKSLSCCSDIDSAIFFEAPLRLDIGRLPCLAAKAAPAAICSFFDRAGISSEFRNRQINASVCIIAWPFPDSACSLPG
jgi:hypothetical protein